ncbi:MAG: metallophosphoesterase [Pseudomonadota bacterium]
MHNFKFIHTADWHIGRVFAGFPDDVAATLKHARVTVIDRIAAVARTHGAAHVLVAGDTYDSDELADKDLRAPIERLRSCRDITWHIIPGNHDPLADDGVWSRLSALGLPDNVRVLTDQTPVEIAPRIWVLPAPLTAGVTSSDPTGRMEAALTPDGATRIGLAHGPTSAFGEGTDAATIDPSCAIRAGLAYLALGDWHGEQDVAAKVRYSGTPEPEQFKANLAGRVTVVSVSDGVVAALESVETAQHVWLRSEPGALPLGDLDALIGHVTDLGARAPDAIVRVKLRGRIEADGYRDFEQRRAQLDASVRHLVWDQSELSLAADAAALSAVLTTPALTDVAERLAQKANAESQEGVVAARALRLLLTLAETRAETERS